MKRDSNRVRIALTTLVSALLGAPACAISAGDLDALPDPTRPPDYTRPLPPPDLTPLERQQFVLNAIKHAASYRAAIINGHLVREGDFVAGARVVRIERDRVVIHYQERDVDLAMLELSVKRQAGDGS